MKKNKFLIITIVIIIIVVGLIYLIFGNKKNLFIDPYEELIDKMNKKETICVLLTNEKNDELIKTLDYYKNTYDIDIEYLDMNFDNQTFYKFIKKAQVGVDRSTENALIVIKDGRFESGLMGYFSENLIRDLLQRTNIIDAKYKDVDAPITDEYKNKDTYDILYISQGDKNLYEYRKLLYKNKKTSYVMHPAYGDHSKIAIDFNKKLGYKGIPTEELPALIKVKDKKIVKVYNNIKLADFKRKIK